MATTVGTAATTLDAGSSGYVAVENTGSVQAIVTRGADDTVLWPGSRLVVTPGGSPVTARTVSGETELTCTTGTVDAGRPGAGGTALDDLAADVVAALAAKAPLVSPSFTGAPTVPTQTAGNSSTRVASTAFVGTAVAAEATARDAAIAAQHTADVDTFAPMVASPGAGVDCGPALQTAFDSSRVVNLQPGASYLLTTPIFLDSTSNRHVERPGCLLGTGKPSPADPGRPLRVRLNGRLPVVRRYRVEWDQWCSGRAGQRYYERFHRWHFMVWLRRWELC
jgi:hypothetical protein